MLTALRLAARNAADEPWLLESREALEKENNLLHQFGAQEPTFSDSETHLVRWLPGFPSPFTGEDPSISPCHFYDSFF
jgi:hypothetical protein